MYDIVIIGAGPIGLYSAILSSLHDLKGVVIESLNQIGGQLTSLYPEKEIIDLAGFKSIKAKEFIDSLYKQYLEKENRLPINLNETVTNIKKLDEGYLVTTDKTSYNTKTILITTGMGSFSPRPIGIANEKEFSNIHYSCTDTSIYKDKDVVVLGGGDSAVDLSLLINQVSHSTSIIHRRNEFRAQEGQVNQMKETNINLILNKTITSLEKENNKIKIYYQDNQTKQEDSILCDNILVQYGQIPSKDNFPIEKENNSIIVKDYYQTSLVNVFACGNIVNYPGKIKNITTGLGEASTIITRIDQIVHPGKNIPRHF